MNRKTFASLSFSLVLALFVIGSLPLSASGAPNAPVGITETPVATETSTVAPTNTPMPTQTPTNAPTQTPTNTPMPTQAPGNTPVPATPTPTLTPASTPTATRVLVLPVAGGPAEPGDPLRWVPEVFALILGGLAALAIGSDPHANPTPRK